MNKNAKKIVKIDSIIPKTPVVNPKNNIMYQQKTELNKVTYLDELYSNAFMNDYFTYTPDLSLPLNK